MINLTEDEITKNWKDENILVSINTLTYNHEKYIAQCIEGILMQKTNFAFELLIHDDASTDNTAAIIKEYEKKYPKIIKPIYQTENQWSKGIKNSATYQYPRAKGKYIAVCEGDDYWIDENKLQIQVEFLENNPDCALVCSNRYVLGKNGKYSRTRFQLKNKYNIKDVIAGYIPCTASIVFRNTTEVLEERNKYSSFFSGDRLLTYCSLNALRDSYIYRFRKNFVVHRNQGQGVWSKYSLSEQKKRRIKLFDDFQKIVSFEKDKTYIQHMYYLVFSSCLSFTKGFEILDEYKISFSLIYYVRAIMKIIFSKFITLFMLFVDKIWQIRV